MIRAEPDGIFNPFSGFQVDILFFVDERGLCCGGPDQTVGDFVMRDREECAEEMTEGTGFGGYGEGGDGERGGVGEDEACAIGTDGHLDGG
jgi:hypothetical protein